MSLLSKVVAVALLGALAGWLLSWPSAGLPPRIGGLRIATANLLGTNGAPEDASRFLAQLDVDVIVLTEWTGMNLKGPPLRQAGWRFLLNAPMPGLGICVLIRGAPTAEAELKYLPPMGAWEIPIAVVRVTLDQASVTILGIHVPPPVPAYYRFIEPTIRKMMSWVQAGQLVRTVGPGRPGDSVVVVGDFNALPWFDVMSPIAESGLIDAWEEARWQPGPTWGPWPGFPSLARIDYIFASPNLPIQGCWTLDLPGSDHRVVVAEVGAPSPTGPAERRSR